jgi:Fungal specific transcription factor domain
MALGLHRKRLNNDFAKTAKYIDNECRKRVFWSAYTLDRYLSVMLGRPRLFQDEDIDQDLPDRVNDEDMTPTGILVKRKRNDCLMDAPVLHAKYVTSVFTPCPGSGNF